MKGKMMNGITEERTDFLYIGIFIPLGNELGLRLVRANDAYDRGTVTDRSVQINGGRA